MKKEKVFGSNIDDNTMAQFVSAMEQPFTVQGALMPDAHLGYSLPIGGVVATEDYILPSWVGYDIGCGMTAIMTDLSLSDISGCERQIFDAIYRDIPIGLGKNHSTAQLYNYELIPRSDFADKLMIEKGVYHLGSLGSGNHFIEIGHDEENHIWIIVHSGSRGLGWNIAKHYMILAGPDDKPREGHYGFDTNSTMGMEYITDLNFALMFALENRKQIAHAVLAILRTVKDCKEVTFINRNHNHAEQNSDGLWVHRKGATHAELDMMGVIPGNMKDGSFIVKGKGNPDSLCSSSHGAGRVMGRGQAKRELSLSEFSDEMEGITAKVEQSTLDEAPAAYKNIFEVMAEQTELVEVVFHIKPVINVKA